MILAAASTSAFEATGRMKWFSSATQLEKNDVLQQTVSNPITDFRLDLRLLIKHNTGAWRFAFDPTLTWTGGDAVQLLRGTGLPLDQLPGSDSQRFFNWSDELISDNNQRVVARVDRFSIGYRQPSWSMRFGRQAISWGNGLVFQPLDLFSAFSPTTIDREFKPGVDSMLFESLVGEVGELQVLLIGRQETMDSLSAHTMAAKWHMDLGGFAFDVIVAEHIREDFTGASLSAPLGGSLVRVDASRICDEMSSCAVNALVNIDYTISIGPALLYVFAELYHNGFGLDNASAELPESLRQRFSRGEVFTITKNFASFGANVTWHPLLSQSFVMINSLGDESGLFQTAVNYEPSDASRMQVGFSVPYGRDDTEFGKRRVDDERTSGGGSNLFMTLSYYF